MQRLRTTQQGVLAPLGFHGAALQTEAGVLPTEAQFGLHAAMTPLVIRRTHVVRRASSRKGHVSPLVRAGILVAFEVEFVCNKKRERDQASSPHGTPQLKYHASRLCNAGLHSEFANKGYWQTYLYVLLKRLGRLSTR